MRNVFFLHKEKFQTSFFSDPAKEKVVLTKDEEKEKGLSHIFYYTNERHSRAPEVSYNSRYASEPETYDISKTLNLLV